MLSHLVKYINVQYKNKSNNNNKKIKYKNSNKK